MATAPFTDMERFFDLFPDRKLASDLFAVIEDARIDVKINREYAGIRRAYGQRQALELDKRAPAEQMPLRQSFVENMVRASLGGIDRIVWPESLLPLMADAVGVVETLKQPHPGGRYRATVEDSAEATLRLYLIAEKIPNLDPETMDDWEDVASCSIRWVGKMAPSFSNSKAKVSNSRWPAWCVE